jgi:hypothetical protein
MDRGGLRGGFKVMDSDGQALAYVYGHADQRERGRKRMKKWRILIGRRLVGRGRVVENTRKSAALSSRQTSQHSNYV